MKTSSSTKFASILTTSFALLLGMVLPALGQVNYTPYTFTTLAGMSACGSIDATGSDARFVYPFGVAVDSAGNVFVADTSNHTIRKVTPAGVVTTLAGSAGLSGTNDGTGIVARFNNPHGVAVDSAGKCS